MAYPITKGVRELFVNGKPQLVMITFSGTQESMTITGRNIKQGGMEIDRYTVSGNMIEIGSAVSSQLTLQLNNADGAFNETAFEGAELYVQVAAKDDENPNNPASEHYIPMGYFTVDVSPRKLSSIALTALDRMVLFDKFAKKTELLFPMTVSETLTRICAVCNVPLAYDISGLPNSDYVIREYPEVDDLIYRQILQWIAEITGTCAYIDWEGKLRLAWYGDTPVETIDRENRYSSDIYENDVRITGVKIVADDTEYISGTDDYCFKIEGNGLIQNDYESIVSALSEKLVGFTYTPYTCTPKRMIHLYPLDCINIVDNKGVVHKTIVTNTNFSLNRSFLIAAKGETATSSGYASANPITKQEAAIIKNVAKQEANAQLGDRVQQVIGLNETIAGALGLYTTKISNPDQSVKYYFHTNPVLADSVEGDVIYSFVGGGFAVSTSGWNDGNPVWEHGMTKDGNAVFNFLSAYGISAEMIITGILQSKDGNFKVNLDTGDISIKTLDELDNAFSTYFKLHSDGIHIMTSGSEMESVFSNAKISFLQNGSEVAYIQYNRMYITEAWVSRGLAIGIPGSGEYTRFHRDGNGVICIQDMEE